MRTHYALGRLGRGNPASLLAIFVLFLCPILFTSARNSHLLHLNGTIEGQKGQTLVSQNGLFALGFRSVGQNGRTYLCIWYTMVSTESESPTVVWTAARTSSSEDDGLLQLDSDGDLVLYKSEAAQNVIWATHTQGMNVQRAELMDSGNFVLYNKKSQAVWQSFEEPTDTMLPGQRLEAGFELMSWENRTDPAPGPFYLIMQEDQNLVLYNGPPPDGPPYWASGTFATGSPAAGATFAALDNVGAFTIHYHNSSGDPAVHSYRSSLDYGNANVTRRITLDVDSNLRMYSWNEARSKWSVAWEALNLTELAPAPTPMPSIEAPSQAPTPYTGPGISPSIASPTPHHSPSDTSGSVSPSPDIHTSPAASSLITGSVGLLWAAIAILHHLVVLSLE